MKRNSTKEAEEMKVIGIGDNVCDKYIHLKTMFPGGQALNFAAYAGMLGADAAYYFNPFEYNKKNVRNLKMYMQ